MAKKYDICTHSSIQKQESNMKYVSLILIGCILASATLFAQNDVVCTAKDKELFEKYKTYILPYRQKRLQTTLEKTARFFLGTPYVGHTLERTTKEKLIVNLRELDCVTFVENVLALSAAARSTDFTFASFCNELRKIRYRDGEINGFASRLHYTSDWVFANEQRGAIKNISRDLGGVRESKTIDFMSTHADAYKKLKSDAKARARIQQKEKEINQRGGFYYLPKDKINAKAAQIPHMAMIAFTTGIKGLDTSHVGFAFKQNDELTFIHASSAQKKVVINRQPLNDYCAAQSKCTGIMIMEILNSKK